MQPVVHTTDLGNLPYSEAWRIQESLQQKLITRKMERKRAGGALPRSSPELQAEPGKAPAASTEEPATETASASAVDAAGYLLFVEHPHVFTIGKSGKWENLLFTDDILKQKGIEVVKTDRGGDITYHGPGQLVGYPVLDLELFSMGVAKYIETLEEVIIRTAAHFGITAQRLPDRTGVWVGNNKLCALGIKCSRYVCMHGFALNIRTDLDYFHGIIPCGINEGGVTSFEKLMDEPPDKEHIQKVIVMEFEKEFGCSISQITDIPV